MNGIFCVFEGIDGSGKSTQSRMLYEFTLNHGINSLFLHEPTEGFFGKKIREILKSNTLPPVLQQIDLFIKDRHDDVELNIKPALTRGDVIIMDRYFYSNAAYQGGVEFDAIDIIKMNIDEGFPLPHRVYFIDILPQEAMDRIQLRRNGNIELFEKIDFLTKVRDNYLKLIDERFLVIDGNRDINEIHREIKDDFLKLLKIHGRIM
jgi:dTMP kinase